MKRLRNIVAGSVGLLALLLFSCTPYPHAFDIPEISKVDVVAGSAAIEFSAYIENDIEGVFECGFMYGVEGQEMIKTISLLEGNSFTSRIEEFLYDSRYQAYAYISNGQNVIRSSVFSFVTPEQPSAPPSSDPDSPSDPEPDVPDGTFELNLPFETLTFTPYAHYAYKMTTLGNADFEVIIPDEVDWIWSEPAGPRSCHFYVKRNCTDVERSCDVVFESLDHDCRRVLAVKQESLEVKLITKSYKQSTFYIDAEVDFNVGLAVIVDENGDGQGSVWLTVAALPSNRIYLQMKENSTNETRQEIILLTDQDSDAHALYRLVQNPK